MRPTKPGQHPLHETDALLHVSDWFPFLLLSITLGSKSKCHKICGVRAAMFPPPSLRQEAVETDRDSSAG